MTWRNVLSKQIDNLNARNGDIKKDIQMIRFAISTAITLTLVSWAEAETIDVKYFGKLDLAPFVCNDITRSSFINRTY